MWVCVPYMYLCACLVYLPFTTVILYCGGQLVVDVVDIDYGGWDLARSVALEIILLVCDLICGFIHWHFCQYG